MTCPICKKEPDVKYRPFCSKRCADIDLGKWFNGSYNSPEPLSSIPHPDEEG